MVFLFFLFRFFLILFSYPSFLGGTKHGLIYGEAIVLFNNKVTHLISPSPLLEIRLNPSFFTDPNSSFYSIAKNAWTKIFQGFISPSLLSFFFFFFFYFYLFIFQERFIAAQFRAMLSDSFLENNCQNAVKMASLIKKGIEEVLIFLPQKKKEKRKISHYCLFLFLRLTLITSLVLITQSKPMFSFLPSPPPSSLTSKKLFRGWKSGRGRGKKREGGRL